MREPTAAPTSCHRAPRSGNCRKKHAAGGWSSLVFNTYPTTTLQALAPPEVACVVVACRGGVARELNTKAHDDWEALCPPQL